ncbi:hypothetical protein Dda_7359 [Drechslerella dactyloides]|uniref:Uncharacterized protein n=1 Tax=Drechslerella dactyloides TaxID=74499 RepID=A0AAD6NGP5_DREDA|nr:hypothetical protein Dda_7359 [Drechslerella dactyloides]
MSVPGQRFTETGQRIDFWSYILDAWAVSVPNRAMVRRQSYMGCQAVCFGSIRMIHLESNAQTAASGKVLLPATESMQDDNRRNIQRSGDG